MNLKKHLKPSWIKMACLFLLFAVSRLQAQDETQAPLPVSWQDASLGKSPTGSILVGKAYLIPPLAQKWFTEPGQEVLQFLGGTKEETVWNTLLPSQNFDVELEYTLATNAQLTLSALGAFNIVLQAGNAKPIAGTILATDLSSRQIPALDLGKSTGIWQKLSFSFEYDEKRKTGIFSKVYINQTLAYVNIEVPISNLTDFKSLQFKFRGDLALKNLKFRAYEGAKPSISNIQASYVQGVFKTKEEVLATKPLFEVKDLKKLSVSFIKNPDEYGTVYRFNVELPNDGLYTLYSNIGGMAALLIDGDFVFEYDKHYWSHRGKQYQKQLKAGNHQFQLIYWKANNKMPPSLGFFIEGPRFRKMPFHPEIELPNPRANYKPMVLNVGNEPKVLRHFSKYGEKIRPYVISVGDPQGIHFTYDLHQATVLYAWSGDFLDVQDMWSNRGGQTAIPLNKKRMVIGSDAGIQLASQISELKDTLIYDADIQYKGYVLDDLKIPVFRYALQGAAVKDQVIANPNHSVRSLTRKISIDQIPEGKKVFITLGLGKSVLVGKQNAYFQNAEWYASWSGKAKIVEDRLDKGLLLELPVTNHQVDFNYTINW